MQQAQKDKDYQSDLMSSGFHFLNTYSLTSTYFVITKFHSYVATAAPKLIVYFCGLNKSASPLIPVQMSVDNMNSFSSS